MNFQLAGLHRRRRQDAERHPTLEEFEQQTGITVNYTDDVNDNAEFFAKVQPARRPARPSGAT